MGDFFNTLWQQTKKVITTYGPYVLRFIVDQIVWLIMFLKKQIAFAIQQLFKI